MDDMNPSQSDDENIVEIEKLEFSDKDMLEIRERFSQSMPSFEGIIIHEKVRILDANQTLAAMFGYPLQEVIGLTILELITPESRSLILKHILLHQQSPYEIIGQKKDGSTFPIRLHSKEMLYQEQPVRAIAIRTLTEHKQEDILESLQQAKSDLEEQIKHNTSQIRFANERLRSELDERKHMEAELNTRALQQAAISNLGQQALSGTNLSTLMDEVVTFVTQTLAVGFAGIWVLSAENLLLLQHGRGWKNNIVGEATVRADNNSHVGYTLTTKQPIIVPDFAQETRFKASALLQEHHILRGISVVIEGRKQPFGVLGAHTSQSKKFTEDDVFFLQAIANILAMAVDRKQSETETIQRNRELVTLQSASMAITSTLDLQQVLDTVMAEMANLLEVKSCTIFEWDQNSDIITLLSKYGYNGEGDKEIIGNELLLADYPLRKQILIEQRARQISINQSYIELTELDYLKKTNNKTLILLPMVFQENAVGLVQVMDQQEHTFPPHQVSLAQLLANQAASAISNARLHNETQRRAQQLTLLHELDRAMTTSLRVSDVYYALAHHASYLLPYHWMSITLLEGNMVRIAYIAGEGDNIQTVGDLIPYKGSNIGWVIERNQPSLHHNIASDVPFIENKQLVAAGIRSIIIVPLRIKGKAIGTWNIGNPQVGAYTPDDLAIVQSIADQLAIAIENARLYKQARQEIKERQRAEAALEEERALLAQRIEERTAELKQQYRRQKILAEIELTINQPQELQSLLEYIANIIEQTLQISGGVNVVLWDEESDSFSVYLTTVSGQNTKDMAQRIRSQNGATRWIIDHRQPLAIADFSQLPFTPNPLLLEYGHQSFAGAPLLVEDKALGVLYVLDKEQRQYAEEDIDFMMAVANRVAVAIAKVRLYESLEQANAELARASRLKDEFLASMSHELRTPLAAILGMSELIKVNVYGPINERQLSAIQTIEESGRHLLTLINDILDLSKIGAGKLDLQIDPVPIERLCQSSLQFIEQIAAKKMIEISLNCDDTVKIVQADERRLKQILVNLLSNAVKFTFDKGKIGLDVWGDKTEQQIHFSVWDTGVGIAAEDMDKLFEPFIQLDSRLARKYTGTGLGLALVERMVTMHEGTISVKSTLGKGSRFTISLPWLNNRPLHKLQTAEHKLPLAEHSDQIIKEQKQNYTSPPKDILPFIPLILIAEDDKNLANLLCDYLVGQGYEVMVTYNGIEAVAQSKAKKPDLILMDVQMPEMNGLDAIRHLRAEPEFRVTPIIVLTALAMPGDREQCLEAGANDYMSKPINLKQLNLLIQAQLAQYQIR